MAIQLFTEGMDPTPLPCISKADILQLIRAATPKTSNGVGMVVMADSAPDVVTTPALAKFIWLKSVASVPNGEFYYYNGSSWTLLSVVNGASLANNSVTLAKLSISGAAALDIIQLNGAGTALVFTSILNALQANSITLAKLVNGGAGNFVFSSLSSVNQFITMTQLASFLVDGTVSYSKIVPANIANNEVLVSLLGVNQWMQLATIVNYITDNTIPLNKLLRTGGTSLQSIRLNAAATGWEFYTPSSATVRFSANKASANQTIATTTITKVTFGTEDYDQGSNFNVGTGVFTAPAAGIYRFRAKITFEANGGIASNNVVYLYKNAAMVRQAYFPSFAAPVYAHTMVIDADLQLATNDTIEVYVNQQSTANRDISGLAANTSFEGIGL